MHARQSTMSKLLKVFVILLLAIALVRGQNNNNNSIIEYTEPGDSDEDATSTEPSTSEISTDSNRRSIGDSILSIFRGNLLEGILDILQQGPLGFIFRPLGLILRPIFYLVDLILRPIFYLVRIILTPVVWLLDVILLPFHGISGILNSVWDLVKNLLSWVSSFVSLLISNISAVLGYALEDVSDQTGLEGRSKRSTTSMMGMAWNTLTSPFRFALDILRMILSPFHLMYSIAMWPYHFIFGGGSGGDLSSESALSTVYSHISDSISHLLLNVSESSQDAIIELLLFAWVQIKKHVLPALDNLFVSAATSTLVPDDVKTMLSTAHMGYKLLHTFGFL